MHHRFWTRLNTRKVVTHIGSVFSLVLILPVRYLPPLFPARPLPHPWPDLVSRNGRQTSPAAACGSGAALRATVDCLNGIGGRVFLMAQSPADTGAGAVSRGREDASLYGGEKEFRLYQAAPDSGKDVAAVATGVFYKALAKDCATRQVRKERGGVWVWPCIALV